MFCKHSITHYIIKPRKHFEQWSLNLQLASKALVKIIQLIYKFICLTLLWPLYTGELRKTSFLSYTELFEQCLLLHFQGLIQSGFCHFHFTLKDLILDHY